MSDAISNSAGLVTSIAEGSDGGRTSEVSTNDGGRLTGIAPQPPQGSASARFMCGECGSTDIQGTAWVTVNSGEVVEDDGPTDQIWCPECDHDCSTVEDFGFGFELWREAEWSGWFATFAEALAEAKESDRPYEIAGVYKRSEVAR